MTTVDYVNKVEKFLKKNFPQIEMHGGNYEITKIDKETQTVTIYLSGACSGCGISPRTAEALQARLPQEVPEINHVIVKGLNSQTNTTPTHF